MSAVLIVDDDARIRELLARWLAAADYETEEAGDADQALARIEAGGCDVVLCDVVMPGHDGLWLIEQARQRFPTVAMILATGIGNVAPSASLAENVVDYLVKPFERAAVVDAVARARTWHETAASRHGARSAEDPLASWLRGGRTQPPEIK